MSVWTTIRDKFDQLAGRSKAGDLGERDAPADLGSARSRATGGVAGEDAPDTHSTTGTTPNDTFVGRAGGDDPGYAGTTGAEERARGAGGAEGMADDTGGDGDAGTR